MTERLRSALAEIADRAPVAQVPDTTYRRGRRSYRQRVGAGILAFVLVCLGLGSLVRGTTHDDPPVVGPTSRGAVPSQLYGVPERLTMTDGHGRWTGPVETDLAIGTGSVAWTTSGPPVVITASDGAYHLLDLPGFANARWSLSSPALALSPNGRSLAYPWLTGSRSALAGPKGLRVVDLVTGDVRSIPLSTGPNASSYVEQIAWSPDSRWLAWYGETIVMGSDPHGLVRGVIAPGATRSRPLPSPRDAGTVMAVGNTGQVVLVTSNRTLLVSRSEHVNRRPGALAQPISVDGRSLSSAVSPSGRLLSLPAFSGARQMTTLEIRSGQRLLHPLPSDFYPDGAMIVPLGWIDDSRLLAVLDPEGPAPDGVKQRDLVVMTPTRDQTSTFRIVGHADGTIPVSLSVAVDLMTPERYTADLPAPDWPWSTERKIVVVSAVVVAIGALGWAAVGPARRRRYPRR